MGKPRDRNNRMRLARNDDETRKKRVADARAYLYKDHLSFASGFVEARLDDGSLVPTDVRHFPAIPNAPLIIGLWVLRYGRMPFPHGYQNTVSIYFECLSSTSCTK